jgi:hypothetical protein
VACYRANFNFTFTGKRFLVYLIVCKVVRNSLPFTKLEISLRAELFWVITHGVAARNITSTRFLTTQKSAVLSNFAAES